MTAPSAPRIKITYATLRNDNEELHALYDAGLERARGLLGRYHRNFIGGVERDGDGWRIDVEVRGVVPTLDGFVREGQFSLAIPQ